MLLSDLDILARLACGDGEPRRLRIDPFTEKSPTGAISYGLTSAGYDLSIADEYKVFTNLCTGYVDPKNFDPNAFESQQGRGRCVIPPNSFALGRSVERLRIPRDILGICVGKSTYARCGIIVTVTPLEPEWEGIVTIEISNTTPRPAVIYSLEGILQVNFHLQVSTCKTSYADKKGRYQGQTGITLPFVERSAARR